MRRLIVRPEAEADITNAAIWSASREPELGPELLADIHRSIALVLHNPRLFCAFVGARKFAAFWLNIFRIASSIFSNPI